MIWLIVVGLIFLTLGALLILESMNGRGRYGKDPILVGLASLALGVLIILSQVN